MKRSPGLGKRAKSAYVKVARRIYYEHVNERLKTLTKDNKLFENNDIITVKELAKIYGISEITIRKWAKENLIPNHKTFDGKRGKIYFLKSDFDKNSVVFKETLTVNNVAKKFQVTKKTVRKWINTKQLAAYKFQGRWYITAEAIKDFIERGWNNK